MHETSRCCLESILETLIFETSMTLRDAILFGVLLVFCEWLVPLSDIFSFPLFFSCFISLFESREIYSVLLILIFTSVGHVSSILTLSSELSCVEPLDMGSINSRPLLPITLLGELAFCTQN